jgi:hypothetical protein
VAVAVLVSSVSGHESRVPSAEVAWNPTLPDAIYICESANMLQ